MSSDKFGPQFDSDRFEDGNDGKEAIQQFIKKAFDAHHVVPTEPEKAYDNFTEEKAIHQLLDYGGIDFVVDPFDNAPFGVNHRTHSSHNVTLRFDIRSDTGTNKPSELDELRSAKGNFAIVPRYASRAKRDGTGGFEWIRIIDLRPLIGAINAGLTPEDTWTDGDVVAWLFDYDLLRQMDVIESEFTTDRNH